MKIVQALEDYNILLKGITKTIENEKKKKRMIFRNVIRYFRCKFIGKHVNKKRNSKSMIWK